jgi:transposase-like protein
MSSDQLSEKKLSLIEALSSCDKSESEILAEHNISRETFYKWLGEANFIQAFDSRINQLRMQTAVLIAGYACSAVKKLIELTESEKQETARKACLDILNLQADNYITRKENNTEPPPKLSHLEHLPKEKVSKLLEVLAENS